jgi:hypothetical protein
MTGPWQRFRAALRAAAPGMAAASLAACHTLGLGGPAGVAPRACTLAGFEHAKGQVLARNKKAQRADSKSEPLQYANSIRVNRNIDDAGGWADAGNGWMTWRYWLRSEEARSMAVRLEPFSLPSGGRLWLCSPDGTSRLGPYMGDGPGGMGKLWSTAVLGNEIWLEAQVPAGATDLVKLRIDEAFAAFR